VAAGLATYSSLEVYGHWKLNDRPPARGEPRFLIGYRAYVNRATRTGAAYEDFIPDRAIWFRLQ